MSTSFTIPTTSSGFMRLVCPEWCTDGTEHVAHTNEDVFAELATPDGGMALFVDHSGPTFGPFFCAGQVEVMTGKARPRASFDNIEIQKLFGGTDATSDPAALRALAAHALATAEWIEAQR